jgi:nicotinate-nucleotide pyrophosphorylase (carboxylating)
VRVSGGHNHRFGLHDGILIKDNHLVSAGGVTSAVRAARDQAPHGLKVEVEVTTLAELEEALAAGADIVLLDNFAEEDWPAAVARAKGRALVEISGGIDLRRARVAASAGADLISVGALTHSVRAVDLSLEFESVAEAVATEGV